MGPWCRSLACSHTFQDKMTLFFLCRGGQRDEDAVCCSLDNVLISLSSLLFFVH